MNKKTKIRKFIATFFVSLFLNFNIKSVHAVTKNAENEVKKIEKEKINKKEQKTHPCWRGEEFIIPTVSKRSGSGKKVGGVLTGYTYTQFMRLTDLWLEEYRKKNNLEDFSIVKVTRLREEDEILTIITTDKKYEKIT
jgi:hypothetical protein